jgi:hypothetical protein
MVRAEIFTIASPLQPQHTLKISSNLPVPDRDRFWSGGGDLSEGKVSVNELDKKNDFGVLRVEGK